MTTTEIPTVQDYLGVLRRYWWLPAVGAGLGLTAVVVQESGADDLGSARATVLVHSWPDEAAPDAETQGRAVRTITELATTDVVRSHVAGELDLSDVPSVDAVAVTDTNLIDLTVHGATDGVAVDIADAYANALATVALELTGVDLATVSPATSVATERRSPARSSALYIVLGAGAGYAAAVALEVRRRSRRSDH